MYGETHVPYTPIGGSNMGISMMSNDTSISGSSQPEGGSQSWIRVSWSLPGGIVGSEGNEKGWYYLEGNASSGVYTTDERVYEILAANNLADATDVEKITFLNHYLYDAVSKFLHFETYPDYGGWNAFTTSYAGCWHDNL